MRTAPLVLLVLAVGVRVAAQTPASPAPAAPAGQAAAAPAPTPAPEAPAPVETYSYQTDGRRDPFQNLLGSGPDSKGTGKRAEGAAGLTVAEVTVSGVLESRGSLIAMIQGPDKKSYIVRAGDKFLDGSIRSITAQGLTIVQEVNDPLSLVKQREIRKSLRSLESAKE
jgi:Tfp pilus assembly protein PilP